MYSSAGDHGSLASCAGSMLFISKDSGNTRCSCRLHLPWISHVGDGFRLCRGQSNQLFHLHSVRARESFSFNQGGFLSAMNIGNASDHTLYIWRVKAEIQCTLQLLFKITSSPVSYRRLPRRSCYILPREMQNCAQTHFRDKTQKVKSCR